MGYTHYNSTLVSFQDPCSQERENLPLREVFYGDHNEKLWLLTIFSSQSYCSFYFCDLRGGPPPSFAQTIHAAKMAHRDPHSVSLKARFSSLDPCLHSLLGDASPKTKFCPSSINNNSILTLHDSSAGPNPKVNHHRPNHGKHGTHRPCCSPKWLWKHVCWHRLSRIRLSQQRIR